MTNVTTTKYPAYLHQLGFLYGMQPVTLGLAKATDDLAGVPFFFPRFSGMNEDGSNSNDWPTIDYTETGIWTGFNDVLLGISSSASHMAIEEPRGDLHGAFHSYSNFIRLSYTGYNEYDNGNGIDNCKHFMDYTAAGIAYQMAFGPETVDTVDKFFNIPYGIGIDRMPKWPSLFFAKYSFELYFLYGGFNPTPTPSSMLGLARSYLADLNAHAPQGVVFTLKLYVPGYVWYFPVPGVGYKLYVPGNPPTPLHDDVFETFFKEDMFKAVFYLNGNIFKEW